MFGKIKEIWNTYGFEIAVGACIIFLIVVWLFRLGKKGTWNRYSFMRGKGRGGNGMDGFTSGLSASPPKTDSKGEVECRRVLEKIFGKPFNKVRPDFLRNTIVSDMNLEIDCYNPELKIGCEYQGAQHYKYIPFFHRNKEAFHNQKYRDYMKRDMCEKNGVFLIEVPYTVKVDDIEGYIRKELGKM